MHKTRLKKGLLLSISTVMLAGVLAGCKGDKPEQPEGTVYTEEQYKQVVGKYNQLANKYKVLSAKYKANQVDVASTSMSEVKGTGDVEFTTIDKLIKFPNKLIIPKSSSDISTSAIHFGTRYSVSPTSNWVSQITGAQVNLEHPSKIRGSIKSVRVTYREDEYPTVKDVQKRVEQFYKGYKKVNIKYRAIFFGARSSGVLSTATVTVDKKKHVLNVGYLLDGGYAFTFIMDYEDNNTGTQQELVETVLKTVTSGSASIRLE